jgi:hypothetical protein
MLMYLSTACVLLLISPLWDQRWWSSSSFGISGTVNAQAPPQPDFNKNDSCVGSISEMQYNILYELFTSTNGENWIWDDCKPVTTQWQFPCNLSDPCTLQWQGVNCSLSTMFNTSSSSLSYVSSAPSSLTGTNSCEITSLMLLNRGLAGTLPDSIGNMTTLFHLFLNNNELSGTLPSTLAQLTNMKNMFLYDNRFTSTVPSILFTLTNIEILEIYENQLTGTIASNIGNMHLVQVMGLVENYFTGHIPTEMNQMGSLMYLYLYSNYFSGTLPYLASLQNVTYFGVQTNLLTGTLSSTLALIQSITQFSVGNNFLEGTIPSELGNLDLVQNMEMPNNYFTGIIPSTLGKLRLLFNLELNANSLTGSFPNELSKCLLGSLQVANNYLTNWFPADLGDIVRLESINVGYNYMTGELPTTIAKCYFLKSVLFNSNYIYGTIPTSWNSLPVFQMLNGSGNMLSGNLTSLFPSDVDRYSEGVFVEDSSHDYRRNITLLPKLESFSLSDNELTGPIPATLFTSTALKTVVLYSNCLSGSLTTSICEASSLTTLIMDSLDGASNCDVYLPKLLRSIFKGFFSGVKFKGTIPECLWQMPALTTLHLSSNALIGSLGDINITTSNLRDVTVASNNLVGSIPASFQQYGSFKQLDLSFNKFSGTLSDSLLNVNDTTSSVFDLTVNRLSGRIPMSLMDLPSLNILDGNLFQCQEAHRPATDPSSKQYECGSNNLNIALLIWFLFFVILVFLAGLVLFVYYYYYSRRSRRPNDVDTRKNFVVLFLKKCSRVLSTELLYFRSGTASGSLKFTVYFSKITYLFYSCTVLLTMFYVVFALVSYLVLKLIPSLAAMYSTHRSQYTWVSTAAYMHGVAPVVVVLICLYVAVFLIRCWLQPILIRRPTVDRVLSPSLRPTPVPSHHSTPSITPSASLNHKGMTARLKKHATIKEEETGADNDDENDVPDSSLTGGTAATTVVSALHQPQSHQPRNERDSEGPLVNKLLLATMTGNDLDPNLATRGERDNDGRDATTYPQTAMSMTITQRLKAIFLSLAIQLVNIVVTLVVNIAYVYAIFQGLSFWSLSLVQLMLGIYKLVWVNGVMSMLIRKLEYLTQAQKLQHRAFMAMFTFIAGPFLATFFSDSSCFRYLVTGPPRIESSFVTDLFACQVNCVTYLGCQTTCAFSAENPVTVDTTVVPGWLYSYQCYSALLSNYIPVLILSFLFSGILFPLLVMVYVHLSPQQVELFLPAFIREVVLLDTIHMHVHDTEQNMQQYLDRVSNLRATLSSFNSSPVQVADTKSTASGLTDGRLLFNSDIIMTKLLLNITMLLTFGLSSPLFAGIICVDAFSTNLLWRILIGRYLRMWASTNDEDVADSGHLVRIGHVVPKQARRRLERATRGVEEGLSRSMILVMLFAGLFWSLGIFDMIGDEWGSVVGGLCTLLSWFMLPTLYWFQGLALQRGLCALPLRWAGALAATFAFAAPQSVRSRQTSGVNDRKQQIGVSLNELGGDLSFGSRSSSDGRSSALDESLHTSLNSSTGLSLAVGDWGVHPDESKSSPYEDGADAEDDVEDDDIEEGRMSTASAASKPSAARASTSSSVIMMHLRGQSKDLTGSNN